MMDRSRRALANTIASACIVAACLSTAWAQDDDGLPEVAYPALPAQADRAQGFVPPGWRLETAREGDLDGDGRKDLLLVLHMQDPANLVDRDTGGGQRFDSNPRMLAIAFAQPSGGYRLVLQDHALVPRPDNPNADDYLDGDDAVAIRGGRVFVRLHWRLSMGGWGTSDTTYTFRWQEGCFRMIGHDRAELQRNSGETRKTSVDTLSGKVRIDTGGIEGEGTATQWRRLPRKPPVCLQDIGDGFEFDPGA